MNERIKQAAELSKSYKTIMVDGVLQSVLVIDPERFAELIVDETCHVLMEMHKDANGNHNYYHHAAVRLKEHFGVE